MRRELYPHQVMALGLLRESIIRGKRRPMLQAPTGFGKTVLAAAIVDGARAKGKRVLFTVPALSLVEQAVHAFWEEGIRDIGVIQANHVMTDWSRPVQIASVQTLQRRELPEADVVVIDEAHRWHTFYEKMFTDPAWLAKPIIGLSATPWTRGLGQYYDDLIIAATTAELIETGYLSPFRVFAPSHPDLTGVRTVAGDYHEGDLGGAMNKGPLVADVVETWHARGQNRSTFVFAVDRAHAKHLQALFENAGVTTGYIDAYTPVKEREEISDKFHDGEIRVVCNVGCLTTGVDWDVRCIVLARPTKSEILYVQIIGRGLRVAEGKDDCLILDHSDNTLRLGFVTDIHHDTLDDGKTRANGKRPGAALPKQCPQCAFLKPPRMARCPACGFVAQAMSDIETSDGELVEVTGRKTEGKVSFYAQLKYYGYEHGHKPGWAANKFREKFGVWPDRFKHVPPSEPTPRTMAWIKSRNIAWAKSRRRSEFSACP
jgi:DNA repair protein RadD